MSGRPNQKEIFEKVQKSLMTTIKTIKKWTKICVIILKIGVIKRCLVIFFGYLQSSQKILLDKTFKIGTILTTKWNI